MWTGLLAAVMCTSKLSMLFKALEAADDRDQPHKAVTPVHLLDVHFHNGVGVSSLDDIIPFLMVCCLDLEFLILAFSIIEMLEK